ncbi:MAG TPA: hypothetical protein VE338_07060 [Ktedonobacterales bacterium]|jgi:hypothetical protein|nr:hypothetical protein [Ktedonobacterales bacterium]
MTNHHHTHQDDSAGHAENMTDEQFLKEHQDELSRSAQRAHWIHSLDEHEGHPGETLATRSHEVIQRWAEERKAVPATVPGTNRGDREGVLRFNFPGYGGDRLEEISWDQFFKTFDERGLIFLFQEHMKAGNQSNFFHLERAESDTKSGSAKSSHETGASHKASSHGDHK